MSFEKGIRQTDSIQQAIEILKANGINEYSVGTEPNDVSIIVIPSKDIAKVETQLIALGFIKKG